MNKIDIAPASREFIHNGRYTKQDTQTETTLILSCKGVPDGLPALQGEGLYPASGLRFSPDVCLSFQPSTSPHFTLPVSSLSFGKQPLSVNG